MKHAAAFSAMLENPPAEGSRRVVDGQERVYYEGYWIKTYPAPGDSLEAKKRLIEALTRRLFNHTEHGINIPGPLLNEARRHYDTETDPAKRRVKAAMLAGALFNRATDIFTKLVDLQAVGIEILSDNPLMRECGRCLLEAMELGKFVLHRSGEEGIDELWGEPFRAFSVPVEDFYESRYIKIGQSMRDIDKITAGIERIFAQIPEFVGVTTLFREFAEAAKIKTETLRTDADYFELWSELVTAAERLGNFLPDSTSTAEDDPDALAGRLAVGLQLIRQGRDLVFYIARARTSMPKSAREFIARCEIYLQTGSTPPCLPPPIPA